MNVTHTKRGEIISISQPEQSPDPVMIKKASIVSSKPSWLLMVETFFDEIENDGIPEAMLQNMLLSKEMTSKNKQHDCLFFRLTNLMTFFRNTPRFAQLMQQSTIKTAPMLLEQLKTTGLLAFNGKAKEKGIPVKNSVPWEASVRRVSNLVAIDLQILEKNYGIVMSNNEKIVRASH